MYFLGYNSVKVWSLLGYNSVLSLKSVKQRVLKNLFLFPVLIDLDILTYWPKGQ
jgi:hypothetical protein